MRATVIILILLSDIALAACVERKMHNVDRNGPPSEYIVSIERHSGRYFFEDANGNGTMFFAREIDYFLKSRIDHFLLDMRPELRIGKRLICRCMVNHTDSSPFEFDVVSGSADLE
jgi:hypothetical protein